MSMDALLDRVDWRCTLCGVSSKKGCGCFVTLQCPKCGTKKGAPLDPTDPPGTKTVRMLCPECCGGDFSLVDYFDKDGHQLLVDGCDTTRERQEEK